MNHNVLLVLCAIVAAPLVALPRLRTALVTVGVVLAVRRRARYTANKAAQVAIQAKAVGS